MPTNWSQSATLPENTESFSKNQTFDNLIVDSLRILDEKSYSIRNSRRYNESTRSSVSSNESSSSNGLSDWYDNLKNDPSLLYSGSISTRSSMSISSTRSVIEPQHCPESQEDKIEDIEDEEEIQNVCIGNEIPNLINGWVRKLSIINGDPFYGLNGVEYSPINSRKAVRLDPYHGFTWDTRSRFQYEWEGDVDKEGRFHGTGTMKFADGGEVCGCWKNGVRIGRSSTTCTAQNIQQLTGEYKSGKLSGICTIVFTNGESIEGHFRDGCLHGLARGLGIKKNLMWVGRFLHGIPEGNHWSFFPVGGCLVGPAHSYDKISSSNTTYIYPDWSTCLVGTFEDSLLVDAKTARLESAQLLKVILAKIEI